MKKILFFILIPLSLGSTVWCGCKKNSYIVGGQPENVNIYKNVSTYDMLKGNPLFDTLIRVIDTAGLKDKINENGTTFFAPSDYSIYNYLYLRTIEDQNTNQYAQFGLDSLFYYLRNNINGTKDSLSMYLVHPALTYNLLSSSGAAYPTELPGDTVVVSYEYTTNSLLGYSSYVSGRPQVVYFTQLWYPFTVGPSNPVDSITTDIGVRTLVKTSGINTQNGVVNVLESSHVLFFSGTKQ